MFDHTPSDKVQRRALGELQHPGCCALCGSGNCEEGYVDTGVYYEYEGQVYICMTCTHQIIDLVGGLLPDEVKHLRMEMETVARQNADLREVNATYYNELAVFNSLIANAIGDGTISVPSVGPKRNPEVTIERNSEPTGSADSGESEPKKSVAKRGSSSSQRPKLRNGSSTL